MPSAKPYSLLHKQIVDRPGATAALAEHRALTLKEIREHFGQSQITLSEALGVSQPAVSKTESSSDPRLSTLESYVKALGGELKVQAIFEGDTGPEVVTINFTAA